MLGWLASRGIVQKAMWRVVGDAYEWRAHKIAGRHAVDCGRAEVGRGSRAANDCALTAFLKGQPFRVRYDIQGIDSDVSAGLARGEDGRMFALMFDGDPNGRGGTSLP